MSEHVTAVTDAKPDIDAIAWRTDEDGWCVTPGVLDADLLDRARRATDRLAAEDIATGKALVYGANRSNRRVHGILQRDGVFAELALHPVALAVAKRVLGYDEVQLAIMSANITAPGGDVGVGVLHADQMFIPGFFPTRLICNMAFFLDDYTEENGATVYVPGSNKQDTVPPAEMPPTSELRHMTGPAGSLAVWDGFIHHATGRNTTTDQHRRGILTTYFPPFIRTQENWVRTLPPERLDEHPGLAAITGFEQWRSLGMVFADGIDESFYNI